jgi:hypothetical protein
MSRQYFLSKTKQNNVLPPMTLIIDGDPKVSAILIMNYAILKEISLKELAIL